MTLGERIKNLRVANNMSQNDLAMRIDVSRQAVTKWENGGGLPEIDNLIALADVFGISVDYLVRDDAAGFTSVVQYDVDRGKDFEMDLIASKSLSLIGHDSEKLCIILSSDSIKSLESDVKTYIEDKKRRISVEMKRKNDLSDADCREGLDIRIMLPRKFIECIEVKSDAGKLSLKGFSAEDVEFRGSVADAVFSDFHGKAEMDIRSDCTFSISDLDGSLEINQIERASLVKVPKRLAFKAVNAGKKCEIVISKDLSPEKDCKNVIELNGSKSTLRIEVDGEE